MDGTEWDEDGARPDGLAIAWERIAREAEEKTGFLDLGRLGLEGLPHELFALTHLRRLNLGAWYLGEDGKWQEAEADIGPNTVEGHLARLAALSDLQALFLSGTNFAKSAPLKNLASLQTLYCSGTRVSDLAPLKNLASLQTLDCSGTRVSDLAPLYDLPALMTLDCSRCQLAPVREDFWFKPSLGKLVLYETQVPEVPAEVLSEHEYGDSDCLDSLRTQLRDQEAGREEITDVKLMVLGNGRVGKTQICRQLRGESYDGTVASTHGITVTSASLAGRGSKASDDPSPDHRQWSDPPLSGEGEGDGTGDVALYSREGKSGESLRLNIWDFGGQDIYHGTHALFLRSRAIFVLAWTPDFENCDEVFHEGYFFRNQPLAYWLAYIRQFAGDDALVIIVQTRCDSLGDDRPLPVGEDALGPFRLRPQVIQHSARTGRGSAALAEKLREAADELRTQHGATFIGAGRALVKRWLEEWRDADAALPKTAERKHRTVSQDEFLDLCQRAEDAGKVISDPAQLLAYLHHVGTVFYQKGQFDDRIILDQSWALEAIYAVFHRDKSLKQIERLNGRFTRADLAMWIWDEEGFHEKDQELLLNMMLSCGICFEHRPAVPEKGIEAEYIAPDHLPARSKTDVAQKWDADKPAESATFDFALLQATLIRSIIARVGNEAGLAGTYWRGGAFVYEAETESKAIIEQAPGENWGGTIRVSTRGGNAVLLLRRLAELVEYEYRRIGMTPTQVAGVPPRPDETRERRARRKKTVPHARPAAKTAPVCDEASPIADGQPSSPAPIGTLTQPPSEQPEFFVSYAWKDNTPEGRNREAEVDRLCAAAEARGRKIIRDKNELHVGEHIGKFMRRLIAPGNQVFVILSDKYLKSPFCMYELAGVWRNCRQDEDEFLKRIRVFTLADAKIWTPRDRALCAAFWRKESAELEAIVKEHGFDILGEKDFERYRLMKEFAHHIGNILATVTDILQPRSFDELVEYGFDDPPA